METIKYIRGNKEKGDDVIRTLYDMGGKYLESEMIDGKRPEFLYFVGGSKNNEIQCVHADSTLGKLVIENGEEISIAPVFKFNVGDTVLVENSFVATIIELVDRLGQAWYKIKGNIVYSRPESQLKKLEAFSFSKGSLVWVFVEKERAMLGTIVECKYTQKENEWKQIYTVILCNGKDTLCYENELAPHRGRWTNFKKHKPEYGGTFLVTDGEEIFPLSWHYEDSVKRWEDSFHILAWQEIIPLSVQEKEMIQQFKDEE